MQSLLTIGSVFFRTVAIRRHTSYPASVTACLLATCCDADYDPEAAFIMIWLMLGRKAFLALKHFAT
jgi:hypothetical protein